MRCYLLLRDNVESGPFTLQELTIQPLQHADLIWIEGESTAWKYPGEIETLQSYVKEDSKPGKLLQSRILHTSKGIFVSLPLKQQDSCPVAADEPVELVTRFSQPLETLKASYKTVQPSFSFPKTFSKPHNALWLVCVFAGLLLAATVIKKMVDAYNNAGTGLEAAAALPATDRDNTNEAMENPYQNALTTELVPIDTATMKPVKKATETINLIRLVHIEANDYQVGFLGGIKNLRLLITNKSAYQLDHVKIDLDYLKPNGAVIKTEHLVARAIPANGTKSLPVSATNRGVKVACRITTIQSKQNSERLMHL